MKNQTIIVRCGDCDRVAVMESPAITPADPLKWKDPAPGYCPECVKAALLPPARRLCGAVATTQAA